MRRGTRPRHLRPRGPAVVVLTAATAALAACGGDEMLGPEFTNTGSYSWNLPSNIPLPKVPADNPMTEEKVELGRHLFYDTRLSGNGTQSCASCHRQELAFTDGLPHGVGSTGEVHPRGSMSLANVAYQPVLTWANPNLRRLEQQALIPMFGEAPVELGLSGMEGELLERLRAEPRYQALFPSAFPDDPDPITVANIARALASFQRSLISVNAPYDRFLRGDEDAISESAKLGASLFFSERLECFHCHQAPMFTGTVDFQGKAFVEVEFFNTGLYNIGGTGAYPAENPGLRDFTGQPIDEGKFKAPSLRNIAVTAPYMHDGSVATLEEVIDHYAAGGRTIHAGPNAGVGSESPNKSGFVKGFTLSAEERRALIDYLESLTDETFLADPRFSDPWAGAGGTP